MPFFSIVIPVFKAQEYLRDCLNSIQRQTFQDFEVIMVDDDSPDECPEICEEFAQKDSRFLVIHKENEGPQKARKIGVERAVGRYVVFVDADDWVEVDWLEDAFGQLCSCENDMLIFGFKQQFLEKTIELKNNIEAGIYEKDQIQKEIYPRMICTGKFFEFGIWPSLWSKIFKRELISKVMEQVDERLTMGEDAVCTYLCLHDAGNIKICEKAFYHYRYVQDSLVQKYDEQFWKKITLLFHSFDREQQITWGEQLTWYKMYLILVGINKEFLYTNNISETCCDIKKVLGQENFKKVIDQFECENISNRDKVVVDFLKAKQYEKLKKYFLLEKCKRKIKCAIKGILLWKKR